MPTTDQKAAWRSELPLHLLPLWNLSWGGRCYQVCVQASVQSSGVAEGGGKITSFFVRKGAGTAACPAPAKPAQHPRCDIGSFQQARAHVIV